MRPGDLLLIADDLTGACDAAVHFAARGVAARVVLAGVHGEMPVTAVSTDSREAPEAVAAARIGDVARTPARIVFKKIDSVLRGRPGFEIARTMDAFGLSRVIVTPAFPALGRRVVGGRLHVDGLAETVDVAARLASEGLQAEVADAEWDADLDRLVAVGLAADLDSGDGVLWAGSGGLASALARALCGAELPVERPRSTGVLFGIGSNHPATSVQRAELARSRPSARVQWIARGKPANLSVEPPMALFLCGGDTASAVLAELGAGAIDLRGEIVPGVPWGYLRGGRMDGCAVVTKSGGFGAADTLVRVFDWFAD
jgi:uncharacterized protein YgbK (DUF1537 family)